MSWEDPVYGTCQVTEPAGPPPMMQILMFLSILRFLQIRF